MIIMELAPPVTNKIKLLHNFTALGGTRYQNTEKIVSIYGRNNNSQEVPI